jgi:hypothetical protein
MRYQALIVTDWTVLLGKANSGGQSSWESQPTYRHHRVGSETERHSAMTVLNKQRNGIPLFRFIES